MKKIILLALFFIFFSYERVIAEKQLITNDHSFQITNDLKPLLNILKKKGFSIRFEFPPRKDVYGLFQVKSKTIWISPISFYQGISRQTILHEATHAAQSCPDGFLKPMDLKLTISPLVKKEIQRILLKDYNSNQFLIEKEAYFLQTQKNAVELLLKALEQRCN
tara:strand:+ start:105 stop:596 length:492 start_codon:yes stop_codon:yes gene_type:complete